MPRIPQYGAPQVGPVQTTSARFRAADNDGGVAGAIGRGLQQAGGAVSDYAQAQVQIEETLAATNADNQYLKVQSVASTKLADFRTKPGKLALDARPSIDKALDDAINSALAEVDPRTKRFLEPKLARLRSEASNEVASYSIGQAKVYQQETGKALLGNLKEMAADADDPAKASDYVMQAKAQARKNMEMAGLGDPAVIQRAEFEAGSDIHYAKVQRYQSVGDIDMADAYVEAHASELTVEHEVAIRAALKGPLQERQAASDFIDATGGLPPQGEPGKGIPGIDSMFAAIRTQESGGRQFSKDGKPLTSSAGAIGIMQVMPGTAPEAARLAGVRWDEDKYRNDPAYNQAIGEAYFKEMLRQFKDPEVAAAAYNAGPGAVRKAISKGGNYLDHLSGETKDYVSKFRARTGSPQQAARQWDKEAVYASIDERADEGDWSFERRERAKGYADRQIAREEQMLARREDAADEAASEWMLGRGSGFTDPGQIPRSIWSGMSVEARTRADAAAKANSKPVEPPSNSIDAMKLHAIQYGNPDTFAKMDLSPFIGKITRAELDAAVSDQAKLRGPGGDKTLQARSAISTAISYQTAFDPAMGKLLDKKQNPENYARVARDMEGFITSITAGKREPTAQEIDAAWKRAVMPVAVPNSSLFGRSVETKPRFEAGGKYQIAVPVVVRERIIASWRNAHNGEMPPDGVIGDIYVQNKGKPGYWQ